MKPEDADALLAQVRACRLCAAEFDHPPRPVLQWAPGARLLIAGQAPGRRVHASGVPFDDASGERLRGWLGIDRATFHDPHRVAIVPMAFCWPGPDGQGGDAPPPPRCAAVWRAPLMGGLGRLRLQLLIGRHALAWHRPAERGTLADSVRRSWDRPTPPGGPATRVLAHPSPRNNRWFAQHRWFEQEFVPRLREDVRLALSA